MIYSSWINIFFHFKVLSCNRVMNWLPFFFYIGWWSYCPIVDGMYEEGSTAFYLCKPIITFRKGVSRSEMKASSPLHSWDIGGMASGTFFLLNWAVQLSFSSGILDYICWRIRYLDQVLSKIPYIYTINSEILYQADIFRSCNWVWIFCIHVYIVITWYEYYSVVKKEVKLRYVIYIKGRQI